MKLTAYRMSWRSDQHGFPQNGRILGINNMEMTQAAGELYSFWEVRSLGDLSSVLALAITFVNLVLISSIKKNLLINATIRPLVSRLEQNSLSLNQSLALFDASVDDFNEALGRCEANVKAVRRRLGIRNSWFCRELLKAAKVYRTERDRNRARDVYNGLQKVIQHLRNIIEEREVIGS